MKACLDGELDSLSPGSVSCGGPWPGSLRVCGLTPGESELGEGRAGSPGRQAEGREGRPLTAEQMLVIL